LTPPLQQTAANICINLILPETTFPGLHFCRWQCMGRYLDFPYLGLFVPWTTRTIDGLFVPWTVRTVDCSYPPGLFVPSWTVRTMDYSYRPWTFRTLDCSYHGLFVPSWTVSTMDCSYRPWTFRTPDCSYYGVFVPSLDDSYRDARLTKKLTFPTKMCLCSAWIKPPEFDWHFPQTVGTF